MPNNKQAGKRLRQNAKQRDANKGVRSAMRSAVKKVTEAATGEEAQSHLSEAMSRVDRAAKRNIIHENAAARTKQRLSKAAAAKS
ncbi:MAG: 30S ribosomal protein S20 [Planctomycetota bacterium]|jgi:small subunit ribosomal protein S20|nr:30S ribosomal protein S20 [Planctomycetota bacterium]MDP6763031.1 30S ribosomal protein S20 [Planctomycetota bacterium]MDP6988202.1 30S ribosomal protein S20 [Planctomycetota bacterium]